MQILRAFLPLAGLYVLLLVGTVVLDALLHLLGWAAVARYLGYLGTVLLVASFAYSLRKRKHLKAGKPLHYLRAHEFLGWLAPMLILVHGGIHFNAALPWLAAAAMVVAVASGLTGKYLLAEARVLVAERRAALEAEEELDPDEIEERLHWDAVMVELMKKWRAVHMPITSLFLFLALLHVASVVLFWRW